MAVPILIQAGEAESMKLGTPGQAIVVESGRAIKVRTRVEFATAVPAGHFVTVTASDPSGNTSEFRSAEWCGNRAKRGKV